MQANISDARGGDRVKIYQRTAYDTVVPSEFYVQSEPTQSNGFVTFYGWTEEDGFDTYVLVGSRRCEIYRP